MEVHFRDYNADNPWDADAIIHSGIVDVAEKVTGSPIIIGVMLDSTGITEEQLIAMARLSLNVPFGLYGQMIRYQAAVSALRRVLPGTPVSDTDALNFDARDALGLNEPQHPHK